MRIGNTDIDLFTNKLKDSGKGMYKGGKDIGVVIDHKLSLKSHINEKVNKANSVMGIIRRTFEFLDITSSNAG